MVPTVSIVVTISAVSVFMYWIADGDNGATAEYCSHYCHS